MSRRKRFYGQMQLHVNEEREEDDRCTEICERIRRGPGRAGRLLQPEKQRRDGQGDEECAEEIDALDLASPALVFLLGRRRGVVLEGGEEDVDEAGEDEGDLQEERPTENRSTSISFWSGIFFPSFYAIVFLSLFLFLSLAYHLHPIVSVITPPNDPAPSPSANTRSL